MSNHRQEPTTFSLTGTVTERHDKNEHPHIASAFSENNVPLPASAHLPGDFSKHKAPSLESEKRTSGRRAIPSRSDPDTQYRTLVVCFDGTGDQFDSDNSNIVKFASLLKKDVPSKQMVYYQAGIGTYTSPQVATPFMSKISKTLDMMFAWNLDAHVMGGYEFLMQNYTAGDKICIFGFSRGAYTARSLAGMIHKVGLLPADNHQQVPFAYKMYTRDDKTGWDQSEAFAKAFSVKVDIEFVGVWDTVDSVGLIPKQLPFTASNNGIIRTFRHAISLDERRAKFKPNFCKNKASLENTSANKAVPFLDDEGKDAEAKKHLSLLRKDKALQSVDSMQKPHEEEFDEKEHVTNAQEVWFAGCHCDVGGGSVSDKTPYSLARIPLRWMIRECFKTKTGILFLEDELRDVGLDHSKLYPSVHTRPNPLPVHDAFVEKPKVPSMLDQFLVNVKLKKPPEDTDKKKFESEEVEELQDAISPIYDQLKISRAWWILEVLPFTVKRKWYPNFARPRDAPAGSMNIHRSVRMRHEAVISQSHKLPDLKKKAKKYKPKVDVDFDSDHITWVD